MATESTVGNAVSMKTLQRLQIALLFLAFILIGATEGGVGVLIPSIQLSYSLDKATVSLLFLAGTSGYLTAALLSGLLIEKFGHRNFILFGTAIIFAGAFLVTLQPPFVLLMLVWLSLGFGIAALDSGVNSYVASWQHNSAILNYLHGFYGVGALSGPLVASFVINNGWSWNNTYYVWCFLAAIVLVSFRLVFIKPLEISKQELHNKAIQTSDENVLLGAIKLKVVWLTALFLFLYVGSEVSLGNWSYSWLTQQREQVAWLAGWLVSGYWIGLTLGRLTLARVSQWVGTQRLIWGCLAGTVSGILILIFLAGTSGVWLASGLALCGYSLGPIFPTTIALISTIVPERLLASAIGLLVSLGSMGAAFFPWLAGNLAEKLGLWSLLPYLLVLTAIMLLLWIMLFREYRKRPIDV
ncbi:MFS transporter [Candidatus Chlorohelix sp.]|uniref:MFS transporter n=1 Tax=Candidatus Chlorohelix sp. TaxID=3139201 RepID=UPI0030734659